MILVASHIHYGVAWETLKASLCVHHVPLSSVIRVIAGAPNESCVISVIESEAHTITVPFNFYEMTAVYGLSRFMHHPRLYDPKGYLLLHDTCVVGPQFYDKTRAFLETMCVRNFDVYHVFHDMRLNILALSTSFIETYGPLYGRDGDKPMAWVAEHGGDYAFRRQVPEERVGAAADVIHFSRTLRFAGSSIVRHAVYAPTLDVYKLVANNDAAVNPPWQERRCP